jgi:mono/diheme cytochrome c family protein
MIVAAGNMVRAAGDPERGVAVATQWCNSCHIVKQNDPAADDAEVGPRFATLTKYTADGLMRLLARGHAGMAALSRLTQRDLDYIAAHLHRLKPEPQ